MLESDKGRGRVITLFSACSNTGKTTIAVNLAVALAQMTRQRVALVDSDVRFGDIGTFLDLPAKPNLADLATLGDEINTRTVEECMYPHETDVSVLTAPSLTGESRKVGAEDVERVVSLLAENFDLIIVDTPDIYSQIVVRSLEMARELVLVCTAGEWALEKTRQAINYLRFESLLGKTKLVVNSINEVTKMEPSDTGRTLGCEVYASVPYDRNISTATELGTPLVVSHPDSEAAKSIVHLAKMLLKPTGALAPSRAAHP